MGSWFPHQTQEYVYTAGLFLPTVDTCGQTPLSSFTGRFSYWSNSLTTCGSDTVLCENPFFPDEQGNSSTRTEALND